MTQRILKKADIEELTGWHDSHVRNLEAAGHFPRRFKLRPGGRDVGWLESEIQAWIEERAVSREAA